jgi:hypothetical protein
MLRPISLAASLARSREMTLNWRLMSAQVLSSVASMDGALNPLLGFERAVRATIFARSSVGRELMDAMLEMESRVGYTGGNGEVGLPWRKYQEDRGQHQPPRGREGRERDTTPGSTYRGAYGRGEENRLQV